VTTGASVRWMDSMNSKYTLNISKSIAPNMQNGLHSIKAIFFNKKNPKLRGHGISLNIDQKKARAVAIGEAIERYALDATKPTFFNISYKELRKRQLSCLDPESFQIFSKNQKCLQLKFASNLKRDTRLDWTWFENTFDKNAKILLPAVFNQYVQLRSPVYFSGSSSGTASGSGREMAKLNAMLELIERDAAMFYWRTKNTPPQITFDRSHPLLKESFKKIEIKQKELQFFYLKSDVSAITIMIVFRGSAKKKQPHFLVSSACHLDPVVAIQKAINELVLGLRLFRQLDGSLPKVDFESNFDETIWDFSDRAGYYSHRPNPASYGFLFRRGVKKLDISEIKNWDQGDIKSNLKFLSSSLKNEDCRVFYKDITPIGVKKMGYFVFRAFSPDLIPIESMHQFRPLGFKRLLLLGKKLKLKKSKKENLNPFPHPFT